MDDQNRGVDSPVFNLSVDLNGEHRLPTSRDYHVEESDAVKTDGPKLVYTSYLAGFIDDHILSLDILLCILWGNSE